MRGLGTPRLVSLTEMRLPGSNPSGVFRRCPKLPTIRTAEITEYRDDRRLGAYQQTPAADVRCREDAATLVQAGKQIGLRSSYCRNNTEQQD